MTSAQTQLDESDEYPGLELPEGLFNYQTDTTKLRDDANYLGFDNNSGSTWIYPTNYPVRKYQYNITYAAMFRNTLVVLPTGLGKTFIAAVVMYNLYRWYPRGKVIFMAPTKPLVAQQIEACYQIMGIAKEDTAELTGKQNKTAREAVWRTKRVFFVTPQVLASDLVDISFPVNDIKLIVVDEAHKARGRYAYTEVIRIIRQQNQHFRVLALSATPGNTIDDVAQVVQNLHISHIEVRSEHSPDVAPYTHKKNIQTVVVKLDSELLNLRRQLLDVIDPYVSELQTLNVINGSLDSLHRGWLIIQQKDFITSSRQSRHPDHSNIMANFSACISLYHSLELLERHGTRIFLNFFEDSEKFYLTRDPNLRDFLDRVRQIVGPNPFSDDVKCNKPVVVPVGWDFGHPKYKLLRQHLVKHFEAKADSRSLVFCEYRESVNLIYHLLLQDSPLVKPKAFVGQNGAKSISQKQQITIMSEFRQGLINVLIATCVAEEGIDVGETDLIICFDISNKNPIRFVQRIGRTGRKRDGKVIMLATEGKELKIVKDVLSNRDKTNKSIANSHELANVLQPSPRLVPTEFDPKCIETFIKIKGVVPIAPENDPKRTDGVSPKLSTKENSKAKVNSKMKKPEKLPNAAQDVRKFFKPVKVKPVEELNNDSFAYNDTLDYPDDITSTTLSKSDVIKSPEQPVKESSPIKLDARVIQTLKKFRSLKRELLRSSITSAKELSTSDVIKNSLTPAILRKYALENNLPYLQSQLNKSSECIVKNSDISIDNIFGGADKLRSFLEEEKTFGQQRRPFKNINLLESMNSSTIIPTAFRAVEKVFRSDINTIESVNNAGTQLMSQMIDPISTQLPQFIETESKYQSYVCSPLPPSTSLAASYNYENSSIREISTSTPIAPRRNPKSSAKKRSHTKSPRRHSQSPVQNSIKKAFEKIRSKEKLIFSTFDKPNGAKDNISDDCMEIPPSPTLVQSRSTKKISTNRECDILEFFGLTNVMDIFVDDEETSKIGNTHLDIGDIHDIFMSDDSMDVVNVDTNRISDVNMESDEKYVLNRSTRVFNSSDDEDDFEESPHKHQQHIKTLKTNTRQSVSINTNENDNRTVCKTITTPTNTKSNLTSNKDPTYNLNTFAQNMTVTNDISDIFADSFTVNDVSIVISSESDVEVETEKLKTNNLSAVLKEKALPPISSNKINTTKCENQPQQVPIKNTDECIQSSQSASPPRRSLASKLSKLSSIMQRSTILGKPIRQPSDDLFATSSVTNEIEELSSSLKENSSSNPSLNNAIILSSLSKTTSCESSTSPLRTKNPLASPPSNQRINSTHTKDNTTSPSILGSRIKFSKLITRVQAKKSSMVLSTKIDECPEPREGIATAPNPLTIPDLSRFDCQKPTFLTQANVTLSPMAANQRNCRAKQVIRSSSSSRSSDDDDLVTRQPKPTITRLKRVKPRRQHSRKSAFIDDECEVSGDNSGDEQAEQTAFLADLINDDVADETIGADMRAVYLQSVRSPIRQPLRTTRQPLDVSYIFSQPVPPDDNTYGECSSFVVSDEDVANASTVSSDECPLERAELILKQRRAAKRLGIELLSDEEVPDVPGVSHRKTKRRRIVQSIESSDDD